jgi:preprotein translocase subunit YajC
MSMLISPAYAQAADGGASMLIQLAPLILIFVVFYFLLIRPQQRKVKDHRQMIENLRRGDMVVTSGGIIGKVVRAEGGELDLEISPGVRVKAARGMIAEVRAKTEPGAAAEKPKEKEKEREPGAYYKSLGVKPDATLAEIEAAYAGKSGDAAAQEAYETLKDVKLRKLYDKLGHDEFTASVKG